jgi:beta-phosphoglucomutase-like phosphatase (HAD superfamily)
MIAAGLRGRLDCFKSCQVVIGTTELTPMFQDTRAVLWDMDGTLLDSAEYHWVSWRDVLAGEGFELTRELFAESFGRRNDATLRAYFGDHFPLSEVERLGAIKEARYRRMVRTQGVELLPGVGQLLARLKANGWRSRMRLLVLKQPAARACALSAFNPHIPSYRLT